MSTFKAKSIRTFIGAKNFELSRNFYRDLGFAETELSKDMSVFFVNSNLSFYLQDYYVKRWINNSMVFLEVDDVLICEQELKAKGLQDKYKNVRFTEMVHHEWGREFFMHDPSGVLWHFGQFKSS